MKNTLLAVSALAILLPLSSPADVYVNETFSDDTIGAAPTDAAQKNASQVTVNPGAALIGTDNAARVNDVSTATAGNLEYNVGASARGSLYVSFDLLNNAPSGTGSGSNPLIFGIGQWSTASGINLGANANRSLGLEFSALGTSSTLKIRSNATAVLTTTYNMSALQNVKIWINDNDTSSLLYSRPDDSTTATLGANSFVIWVNNSLIGSETTAGFGLNTAVTVGDNTLGRVGFNSTTTSLLDFWLDDIYVADPVIVPEPAAASLFFAGLLLFARRRD